MTASSRVSPAPELPVPLDAQTPIRGESLRPPEQVSRLHLGRGHAALVQPSTEVVQRERDLHVLVIDAEGGAGGLDAGAGQRDAASFG